MTVHENITELIGHTPLVELTNYERAHELPATLIGKVESFNPTGSVKDRAAQSMIDAAVEAGVLDDETVIIEPTSGNTGIGLSAIAAVRGNRIIIVMPETMSVERRNLMRAYGAELVLTEGAKGMKGAIEEAERLRFRTRSFPRSSPIRRTRLCTSAPPARRSGRTPMARWISSWPAWAPAARCRARAPT